MNAEFHSDSGVKLDHLNNSNDLLSVNPVPAAQLRRRRILVLYVGGTIGMKKNKEGSLEPCTGYLTSEMRGMYELRESEEIAPFDIIEYSPLLDSSDMSAKDYMRIALDIKQNYAEYDGFLIAHGTDTMHYTASALSFLLYNLAKPVIITGAMVPLAESYNDVRRNLVISMMILSHAEICEVCIFFNDRLFRGNRTSKIFHSFGAFNSPNYPPLGVMGATSFHLYKERLIPQPTGPLRIMSDLSGCIMCFPLYPQPDVDSILKIMGSHSKKNDNDSSNTRKKKNLLDAVILIVNGIGSKNGSMSRYLAKIARLAQALDIIVCVARLEISVSFDPEELKRLKLIAPNIVYLNDMTIAASELKLMYLLGKKDKNGQLLPKSTVARLMRSNLRGEITPDSDKIHSSKL